MKRVYEFGLFETLRAYKGKIVYLPQHLFRLRKSSQLLGIKPPCSSRKLMGMIKKTIKTSSFKDIYVKLILLASGDKTDILIIAKEYKPHPGKKYVFGYSAEISKFRQGDTFLAQIKQLNRFVYERSFEAAKAKGFDEAIILNRQGKLAEGSRTNLFMVKGKEIFTPHLKCGCLPGITRKAIFDLSKKHKIKILEGWFEPEVLFEADEAFLTNSLIGVMPLKKLGRKTIGKGSNRLTRFFMKKYKRLLHGN